MTNNTYIPNPGDIVWIDFDPHTGREQGGRRPAVVISEAGFYHTSRFAIVCPVTSKVRPFESSIVLDKPLPIKGEVLAAQVRSIDTLARPVLYTGSSISSAQLAELREKLAILMGMQ